MKFNKNELVNLSYSLKREIISANKTGAYCNTSIVTCNTRRYHGLLAVPVDRFGGEMHLLLSSLDESLILAGKQFNLGIHCYGDIYEPRGHKYIVDFKADPVPSITYKIGEMEFVKSILLVPDNDQVLIRFELVKAPSKVTLQLKPFLAFRSIHALTSRNDAADTSCRQIGNGVAFRMYEGFPDLNLQLSSKSSFKYAPVWYDGITYSDEARRGFDCREDLFVPGCFETVMNEGESIVLSASVNEVAASQLKRKYNSAVARIGDISDYHDQLVHQADLLIRNRNGHKMITAGFSWMYTGLLRETLTALPGLTLYGKNDPGEFEEILDNLIADEQERLFRRTTQVEAPFQMTNALQQLIDYTGEEERVWKKYGDTLKGIIDSYAPGWRKEVAVHPNGLLWAQMDRVALSWMNAYIDGCPVTERHGYQVETNALWYNALCFALGMEAEYGSKRSRFYKTWKPVFDLASRNFQPTFWDPDAGYLADFVDENGRNMELRPNQLIAIGLDQSPVDDDVKVSVLRVIDNELVTRRGLRSLSPRDPKYKGVYEGTQRERDLAYHNGCTWPYLLSPYVYTCFKLKGESFRKKAEWLEEGFYDDMNKHGVGAFSELYDGDPPHEPHGAISSALSTAALLNIDYLMNKFRGK